MTTSGGADDTARAPVALSWPATGGRLTWREHPRARGWRTRRRDVGEATGAVGPDRRSGRHDDEVLVAELLSELVTTQ